MMALRTSCLRRWLGHDHVGGAWASAWRSPRPPGIVPIARLTQQTCWATGTPSPPLGASGLRSHQHPRTAGSGPGAAVRTACCCDLASGSGPNGTPSGRCVVAARCAARARRAVRGRLRWRLGPTSHRWCSEARLGARAGTRALSSRVYFGGPLPARRRSRLRGPERCPRRLGAEGPSDRPRRRRQQPAAHDRQTPPVACRREGLLGDWCRMGGVGAGRARGSAGGPAGCAC